MANQIKYQIGFDVNAQNLNQLKSSLQEIQKLKISDVMKINNTDAATATQYFNRIKEQASNVENAIKQAFNPKLGTINIQQFNSVLKSTGSSIDKIYEQFNHAGTAGQAAFRNLASSALNTNIQLKETHTLLDKMATTLANTIKWNAASAVVNGFSRSIEQAWGYVKALDTSLNDIRIVTGKSSDEMAKFAVQANNAAKELGKTTTDYTNAALIYAQQGLSDEQIQARAAITLKAANVTGQSTDDVSEQLTAVWNGYKVTADEAQLYVDRLAAVAATTASDLQELSTGMSKVASAAAAMGVGQDQLAAQLSTIISVTRQAPESVGTALRTVYARISDIKAGIDEDGVTLGNYSGKMAELGFNVLDMNGNLRDMGEVMEEIGNKWSSLTREQQISLAQTMAGQRQYSNLIALFDNFEKYNEALATAQGAAGTLQEQQNIYMDQTAAHLQTLKASMEDIYDSLADTDSINSIIDVLSGAANFAANFIDSLGGGIPILQSLGSIGLTVFSQQIAKGINTTITNLEIGKNNARQFDQALQATKDWQGIPALDKTSQDLLKNKEQLLDLSRLMTPEQFSGMQEMLNKITASGDEIAVFVEKEIEPLQKVVNLVSDEKLENIVGKDIQDQIKNDIQSFMNLAQAVEQTQNKINKLDFSKSGKQAENNFKNIKNSVEDAITKIDLLNQQGFLDKHQDELQQLTEKYNNLPQEIKTDQAKQKYSDFFNDLKELALSGTAELEPVVEKLFSELGSTELTTLLQKRKQDLEKAVTNFVTGQQRIQKAATIESYAKMAGGIAQVGSAIQQIQNLGSIWANADLDGGQKLLQTITNLSMSAPMLINGYTKATTALGFMRIATEAEDIAAIKATTTEIAHAGAVSLVETASGSAAVKVELLNTTLMLNPFVAVATAVIALGTAFGILANAIDKARQAEIERRKEQIEKEQKTQEEIRKNEQLYTSIEEVNQKYKDGQISRTELKTAVQDLTDQYGLQKSAVDNLTGSYSNLAEGIKKARAEAAKQLLESAKRGLVDAEQNVINTAVDSGRGYKGTDNFRLVLDTSTLTPELTKALQEMQGVEVDYNQDVQTIVLKVKDDAASIANMYDQLDQIYVKQREFYDDATLNDSILFQELDEQLENMSPAIQDYHSQIQAIDEGIASVAATSGEVDFSNIKTGNDYLRERLQLITAIAEQKGISLEDAAQLADNYLKGYQSSLYTQFGEFAKFADDTKKKLGEDNPLAEEVTNMIGELDEQHFDALMNGLQLSPSVLSSWQLLKQFVEYIASQDLSNIKFTGGSFEENQQAAIDQYGKYQGIQDTVREGKGISAQQFVELDSGLQEFFNKSIDGTYRMQGAAKEFFAAVDSLKLQGFQSVINDINSDLAKVQSLQSGGFDYESLDKNAFQDRGYVGTKFDRDLINSQLDYLDIVGGKDMEASVQSWRDMVEQGENLRQVSNQVYQAMGRIKDQTKDLDETHKELTDKQIQAYHNLHDAMFPTDSDIDASELAKMTQVIQQMSTSSEELADSLQEDGRAAEDVAEAVLRFDDAIKDVSDNYEDWMSELSNPELAKVNGTLEELRDAYADLLDLDGTSLSDDFLESAENLDLMKAAAQGSEEAYDDLMEAAQQDIAIHAGFDAQDFNNGFNDLMNKYYQGQNLDDMQIGASLNNQDFLNGLSQMVDAAGMTAQQATDYLASMGVDAEVIETDTDAEEESEVAAYDANARTVTGTVRFPQVSMGSSDAGPVIQAGDGYSGTWQYDALDVTPKPEPMKVKKQSKAFGLKVISANKSSGGGFKYKHASNAGGGGGGKKGGGGGGGGGGGAKPDTSKKEKTKRLKRTADPYHDVNRDLKKIDRSLQKLTKDQDKLFGKQYIDNLNKQNATLQKSIAKLKEKQKIQKQDLKNQRETLKNLGFTFDKYGNITNYQQLLTAKQAEINGLIDQRNKLVQEYNKSTDKAFKQRQGAIIKQFDDKIKQGQDVLKQLQDGVKQYEDTQNAFGETNDAIDEAERKKIENNIKKFRYSIELRLDLGEATRDWNKFVREVLQPTDILRDSEFDELLADTKQSFNDLRSYFADGGLGGSVGTIEALTSQLKNDLSEINQINETGWSDIYGKDKAQAMEHLKQDWEDLMDQMEEVQQLIQNIDKAYLEMPDYMAEQFDKQIEGYDYVNELIQHDIDLLQILYGEESYAAMDKYYTKMVDNQNKQIDSFRKQADFWKQQRDAAIAAGQTNMAEKYEENYKKAIQNINSAIQDGANLLKEKYTNTINLIFDELNNKLTNGKGLSYLGQEWEYMQDAADEYLDTVNSAYELQSLENKFQKAINNTEGLKNQKALKKLMDEQLENLKAREKLTQYDVDRAEKLLQVQQARIALEQAQSSKTSLRLKRDAQGNYSYQYVADEQGIQDAQQGYLNAQNELYNFDNDKYKQNLDDMYNAYQEFQEKIAQIRNNDNLDAIQKMQQEDLAWEAYQDKITGLLDQNLNIRNNLMDSAIQSYASLYNTNVDNYRKMSDDQRDILMNELVPEWDSGIQIMMNKIVEEGGFIPSTQDAFEELHKATYDYEKELEQLAKTAGISLDDVAEGTDDLTEEFSDLVEENDQLINRMGTELDAIRDLKTEADALGQQYKEVTDAAKDMVTQIQQVIQNEYDQAASYQAAGHAYEAMTSTIYNAAVNLQNNLSALFGDGQQFGNGNGNGTGDNAKGTSKGENNTKVEKPGQSSWQDDYRYSNKYQMYYTHHDLTAYATGGYTGNWNSNEGRVAMLHEKQLVLNQDDTKNFLSGISILRQIAGNFKGGLQTKMSNIKSGFNMFNNQSDTIEQNVKIEASFPNVNSKQQIEDAFNNLVNLAAQRAMRR